MRRSVLVVAAVSLVVVVAGCGGVGVRAAAAAGQRASKLQLGTVVGTLGVWGGTLIFGHPACGCHVEAGTVRLMGAGGRRIDMTAGKSGRFSARVPVGRYEVIAGLKPPMDWPMGSCIGLRGAGAHTHFDGHNYFSYLIVRNGERLHVVVGCEAA